MKNDLPLEKGIYRHYKGQPYAVLGIARHSESHEPLVVYQALYDSKEFGNHALWVRPLHLFLDTVHWNGKECPRFERQEYVLNVL